MTTRPKRKEPSVAIVLTNVAGYIEDYNEEYVTVKDMYDIFETLSKILRRRKR